MENNFANWENANSSNLDFPFDYNPPLNLKPSSPFHETDDPFTEEHRGGFNTIIGNDNMSSQHFLRHNGSVNIFGQNDFLTNYYQVTPITLAGTTNFSLNTNNSTNNQLSSSSSYNPFLILQNDNNNDDTTINCNNDNWAAFDSDNFADFDSHFAEFNSSTSPPTFTTFTTASTTGDNVENKHDNDQDVVVSQTFVATTQTIEISTAPPVLNASPPSSQPPVAMSPKAGFVLGGQIQLLTNAMDTLELDEDEFFSLRDDSNDMNSLTDDKTRNAENTEVPDDDDDDFASADER